MLIKLNSQYYNISAKEAEILNRLEIESVTLKSTTMLDFFTAEIKLTRLDAWDEVRAEFLKARHHAFKLRRRMHGLSDYQHAGRMKRNPIDPSNYKKLIFSTNKVDPFFV